MSADVDVETITRRDIIAMIVLVSTLDPADYPKSAAKSMIYRAKTIMEDMTGPPHAEEVYFRLEL